MSRLRKNAVRLYRLTSRTGSPGTWWGEFNVFEDELDRLNNALPDFIDGHQLDPDQRGRIRVSFRTPDERVAVRRLHDLEERIKSVRSDPVFGLKRAATLGVKVFFDIIHAEETALAAKWQNPAQAREIGAIHPDTPKRNALGRGYFLAFLAERFAGKTLELHQVRVADVRAFRQWMTSRGRAVATQRKTKDHLSGLWREAISRGFAAENPWTDKSVRIHRPPKTERITLLQAEHLRLKARDLAALPSTWDNNAIIMMMLTGARPSDLCTITRGDIDWKSEVINDAQTKVGGRRKPMPLTPRVKEIVGRQLASHTALFLFPWRDGQTDRRQAAKRWNRQLERVAGKGISCKTFRYTFETAARELNIPQSIINELMGHDDDTIADVYTHHHVRVLHEAAVKIQAYLVGDQSSEASGQRSAATAMAVIQ